MGQVALRQSPVHYQESREMVSISENKKEKEGKEEEMELANRLVGAAKKAANNDTVVNVFLVGCFAAIGVRSYEQQKNIDALEAEKESLAKSNKDMKKTLWHWKQQLYAEATTDSALVPLATLKTIYGDPLSQSLPAGDVVEKKANSPASKLVI